MSYHGKKILTYDVSNLQYRSLFKNFDPLDEEFNGFKANFIDELSTKIMEHKPDMVVMAMDSRKLWRRDIDPLYKDGRKQARKESPVDFERFFPIAEKFYEEIKQIFPHFRWILLDRIEADDIIAVLTMEEFRSAKEIINISTDGDMAQLYQYSNYRQWSHAKRNFLEVLNPKKELMIKILTGDKSDNIPNVKPRCGPKTAEKMLNEGLDEYLQNEAIKTRFTMNKQLIDFDEIPVSIRNEIKEGYNESKTSVYNHNDFMKYTTKAGLSNRLSGLLMNNLFVSCMGTISRGTQLGLV